MNQASSADSTVSIARQRVQKSRRPPAFQSESFTSGVPNAEASTRSQARSPACVSRGSRQCPATPSGLRLLLVR